MKATHLALLFAVVTTAVLCQNALQGMSGGFYMNTGTNCFLQITYKLTAAQAILGQQYKSQTVYPPSPLPAGCVAQPWVFTSFFVNNTPPAEVLAPYAPVNASQDPAWYANFTGNLLVQNNGTGCVKLAQNSRPGLDQYLCSFNYAGTPIYLAVFGTGSFNFDTNDASITAWLIGKQDTKEYGASTLVVARNQSFPDVTADIYSSCGSGNKHFYSLQTLITVTTSVDLAALIPDEFGYSISRAYILVKKYSNFNGPYLSYETPMSAVRNGQNCWTLGVTWDKVLPDMNYCAGGCWVTFIFANTNDIYVLKTTGIQTVSNLRG